MVGGIFGTLGLPMRREVTDAHRAAALDAMGRLGIAGLAGRDIMTLSTGQARRVLVARELVRDPRVLVFDEPCTGLDPQCMYQLRETKRTLAALNAGLKAIVCVGESLQQREEGVTEELVRMQTKIALRDVTAEQMANVVIAYEPVWAIGTGKTATADQAQEVCAQIRKVIGELYGDAVAQATTVQYGGSMNAKNCEELLSKQDVDGGLIGGASLKAADFAVIVNAASKG